MKESNSAENKRRFRSVLIHKPMQREFPLVVITLLIISAMTIGFVIHATIREAMMGGGYRFGKITPYEVMSDLSYDLIVRVSLVLFITVLAIAIFGVFFLHRIAGPVYRFRSVLHRVSRGEIPDEFRLREGDFFVETMEDLNFVLQILRKRRERVHSLKDQVEKALGENPPASVKPLLEDLRENLVKIE